MSSTSSTGAISGKKGASDRYLDESGTGASAGLSGSSARIAAKGELKAEKEREKALAAERVRVEKERKAEEKDRKAEMRKSGNKSVKNPAENVVLGEQQKGGGVDEEGKLEKELGQGREKSDEDKPGGDVPSSSSSICTVPAAPPSPLTLTSQLSEATTEGTMTQPGSCLTADATYISKGTLNLGTTSKTASRNDDKILCGKVERPLSIVAGAEVGGSKGDQDLAEVRDRYDKKQAPLAQDTHAESCSSVPASPGKSPRKKEARAGGVRSVKKGHTQGGVKVESESNDTAPTMDIGGVQKDGGGQNAAPLENECQSAAEKECEKTTRSPCDSVCHETMYPPGEGPTEEVCEGEGARRASDSGVSGEGEEEEVLSSTKPQQHMKKEPDEPDTEDSSHARDDKAHDATKHEVATTQEDNALEHGEKEMQSYGAWVGGDNAKLQPLIEAEQDRSTFTNRSPLKASPTRGSRTSFGNATAAVKVSSSRDSSHDTETILRHSH